MTAWHGSPHDHDKFDSSKIGTGEGALAYGHGLYFADSRSVAEWYKNNLAPFDETYYKDRLDEIETIKSSLLKKEAASIPEYRYVRKDEKGRIDAESYSEQPGLEKRKIPKSEIDRLNSARNNTIDFLKTRLQEAELRASEYNKKRGKLYQVELTPSEDEYLDWDKSLGEQSERVRTALLDSGILESYRGNEWLKDTKRSDIAMGSDLYHALTGHGVKAMVKGISGTKAASEYLHSIGIRGIRYLDGTSRSAGEGNHNYVIFDDKDVSITEKFSRNATATGLTASQAQSIIAPILAKWKHGEIKVIQSVDDLPADLRDKVYSAGAQGDTEGIYTRNGKVWIVADHLATAQRACFNRCAMSASFHFASSANPVSRSH